MRRFARLAGLGRPALGGLLLGVSYLPGPFLALNLGAFLPLLDWLEQRRAAPALERLRGLFVFGLVAQLVALHFMYSMLRFSWLALLLYLGMSAAVALRMALSLMLGDWLRRRTRLSWALLLPAAWITFEWLESFGDLRMTGEHLAHTVAGYPFLIQFADLVGHYGVGAFLLVVNGLLFQAVSAADRRALVRASAVLAGLVLAVVAYDAWAWTRAVPARGTVRIALVQPDVRLPVKHDPQTAPEQWRVLSELSVEAAARGAELIVWPESALPHPLVHWLEHPESYAAADVGALARSIGVPILFGAEYARIRDRDDFELYNAALAVDAEGRLLERWGAKVYLVPFTEGVPFRDLLGPLVRGRGGQWRWLSGGFTPGPGPALLELAGARVGVLVCFEQLFPDLARRQRNAGAELQVVITNDAWWARSLFQQYQANALRLRAIENRTAFVRVANTGISGFVDPHGRYHERTALFEKAVALHDVPRTARRTVYDRTGDLAAWLAAAGVVAASLTALGARTPARRRRPRG